MNFKEFFYKCNYELSYYHSKVISDHYNISENLQSNIHDFKQFKRFLYLLTNSKLRIRCNQTLDPSIIYNNYILPSAIYLYYMHTDINNLNDIDLYLVEDQSYSIYRKNVSGEYGCSVRCKTKNDVHVVFVRYYKENTLSEQLKSMGSLFHELTHLIDNTDFKDFGKAYNIINYHNRWHEIKAKYLSEFFVPFYLALKSTFHSLRKTFIIESINDITTELNNKYCNMDNLLNEHYIVIDNMLKYPSKTSYSIMFKHSSKISSLIKSLLLIEQIQQFFYNIQEVLEK